MKYNIKTENTFGRTLRDIVLKNRELTEKDVDFLLNPTSEYQEMPFKIKNVDKGIELFISELDKGSNIGILVDTDVDGYTSSALMYLFLINECQVPKEKITLFFHDGKFHGLDPKVFKRIKKSSVEFLIIPDASTNDFKEIKELLSIGKRILVLDHHRPQSNSEEFKTVFRDTSNALIGVIVNNQLDEYSHNLSGVGVVYKFLVGMTENELEHYLDLVAIGCIADIMDIHDKEVAYLVHKGLNNIRNEFFKEILKDFDLDDITPETISFNLANIINGTIRFSSMEECELLFKALIGEEKEFEYKPRKSKNNPNPQVQIETLQQHMVRIAKSVKQKQDKKKKECIKLCEKYIEENNCNDSKVLTIIDEERKLVDKRITGLIATNLIDIYKKPVVLLSASSKKDKLIGSMRTYGIDDFKSILEKTEILTVKGHNGSAGVETDYSNIRRVKKRIDKVMEDVEVEDVAINIDCVIDLDTISFKQMNEIVDLKPLWFTFCPKPTFILKDLKIKPANIKNPYPTLLTFDIDGITFKKEFCSRVFKEDFLCEEEMKGIFGRPDIIIDEMVVTIEWDDFRKKPCFGIKSAKTHIDKDKKKKDKDIPF